MKKTISEWNFSNIYYIQKYIFIYIDQINCNHQ